MKKIIISPFSRKTHITNSSTPKDYLFWPELIELINKEYYTIQIGIDGEENLNSSKFIKNTSINELKNLLKETDTFIAVDNFFPHFAHYYGYHGIVLFSKSDPNIFGYKENVNLLKDRKHLRKNQFNFWEGESIDSSSYILPSEVILQLKTLLKV